ncbi:MAG: hypothetical protein EOP09_18510 [Proteobacteria bacterium]|nr:MAG: hypothetical protein EOP09_18510 [Pseudomonadota bacterium]
MKLEVDRIATSTEFNGRKLLNGEGQSLDIQVGLNNNPAQDRFSYDTSKTNTSSQGLGVSDISTMTKEDAQNNLTKIDTAISTLSANRSEMGALQNRLQSSVQNMQVYNENLSGARSRIADVDVASATADMTKNNILTQANTAVLGQANQNAMLALKLIG